MFDHPLEEVGALFLPVDAGKGFLERRQHRVLDAVGARGGETFDHHGLESLDHHAAAHLDGRGDAELLARNLGVEAQLREQRRERLGAFASQQQRHLDAIGRDRGHDRAFDVAAAIAVDQIGRAALGARRRRIEVQEPGAFFHRRRAGLRHRHRLARRDGGNDEIGLRGEFGMGGGQRDTVPRRMIAQSAGLVVAELEVIGSDPHVLPAQVFGENAADFAITDEAYIPALRVGRDFGHAKQSPDLDRPGESNAATAFEFRPSRSPSATCRCRMRAGRKFPAACSLSPRCQVRSAAF